MENPINKPWKEICGLPPGWHTIPIWGWGHRPIGPLVTDKDLDGSKSISEIAIPDLMRQKVCYGVLQFHVDGTGLVTHKQSISFVKPFIREDMPDLKEMTRYEFEKWCSEILNSLNAKEK
jgi:hypothetical protein